jgi:hypothetical protein
MTIVAKLSHKIYVFLSWIVIGTSLCSMQTALFAQPKASQVTTITETDSVPKQSHLWGALGFIFVMPIGEFSQNSRPSFTFDVVNLSYDMGRWSLYAEYGNIRLPLSSKSLYQNIEIIDVEAQFGLFFLGVDYNLLNAQWSPYIAAKIGALQMIVPSVTLLGRSPTYSLQLGSQEYWYPMTEWSIGVKWDLMPNVLRVFGEVEVIVVPVPTRLTSGVFSMTKFHIGISTTLF